MLCELFRHTKQTNTRGRETWKRRRRRERGRDKVGVWPPWLLRLTLCGHCATAIGQEDSLCFVLPLVSVPRRGQRAGDFGDRGWEGDGHPQLSVGSLTSTQALGMGGGGGGGVTPTFGQSCVRMKGQGWEVDCGVGWSPLQRGSTRKNATPHPMSPTPTLFLGGA